MKNFPKNSRKFSRFFGKIGPTTVFSKHHTCKKLIISIFYNPNNAPPEAKRSAEKRPPPRHKETRAFPKGLDPIKMPTFGFAKQRRYTGKRRSATPAQRNSGVPKGLISGKKNGLRLRIIAALYAKPETAFFAGYQSFGDAQALRMGDIMPGSTFAP